MLQQLLPSDAPRPRLCVIRKNYISEEYGFNLHAEKGKGQFIGKVDPGSPADIGGLRQGDRILKVNGASIIGDNHKQVVQRIKEDSLQTQLLVMDDISAQWYKDRSIPIDNNMMQLWEQTPLSEITTEPTFESHNDHDEVEMMTRDIRQDGRPLPRLCRLRKQFTSDEFGFNLHAGSGKGHFIGKVDDDSIAAHAGVERGQRIVGVNGELIYRQTSHKQVVALIRQHVLHTDLLLASPEVDEYFREHGLTFSFNDAMDAQGRPVSQISEQNQANDQQGVRVVLNELDNYLEAEGQQQKLSPDSHIVITHHEQTTTTTTIIANSDSQPDTDSVEHHDSEGAVTHVFPLKYTEVEVTEASTVFKPPTPAVENVDGIERTAAVGQDLKLPRSSAEMAKIISQRTRGKQKATNLSMQDKRKIVDSLQ